MLEPGGEPEPGIVLTLVEFISERDLFFVVFR